MQLVGSRDVQQQQFVAQFRRELVVHVCKQPWLAGAEVDQHRVDPIHAGAGHQADVKLGLRHDRESTLQSRHQLDSAATADTSTFACDIRSHGIS